MKGIENILPNVAPAKYSLQQYLDKAYAAALAAGKLGAQPADDSTVKLHIPISLFAHVKTGDNHIYAGVHDDEVHFSASLLKVAAMFAAFSLRAEARQLAAAGASFTDQNVFFTALSQQFNYTDAVPAIQSRGVGLNPRYKDVLKVTGFGGGTLQVDFNPIFSAPLADDHAFYEQYKTVYAQELSLHHITDDPNNTTLPTENAKTRAALNKVSHMYRMIVPSNNTSAGECIRRLGYAYINVKLMNGGFYDSKSTPPKGIWLAADFAGGPRVEIDSVNDGKSAQATTSRQMARMFSLIQLNKLIDGNLIGDTSNKEMEDLLKEAQGVDDSWISRFPNPHLNVVGTKVGLANLKPNTPPKGPDVYSEGVLLTWNGDDSKRDALNLKGEITVCWQNLRKSAYDTGVPAIATMIETAYSGFLEQTPPV